MRVLSVVSEKGGTGKTTLAIHLARAAQLDGRRVVLVDLDPQHTASTWRNAQSAVAMPDTVYVDKSYPYLEETLLPTLRERGDYDLVVVDNIPGLRRDTTPIALGIADFVLVPVRPSPADLWATRNLATVIRRVQEAAGAPDAAIVLSQQVQGTLISSAIAEALERLGLPVLDTRITHRVAFAECIGGGRTVYEHEPNGKAQREIESLYDEIRPRYEPQS